MTTVTLRWPDPEDAGEFLRLRDQMRRDGWLPDTSRDELLRLVGTSGIVEDGSDEGSG